jgi:hypothetical protein
MSSLNAREVGLAAVRRAAMGPPGLTNNSSPNSEPAPAAREPVASSPSRSAPAPVVMTEAERAARTAAIFGSACASGRQEELARRLLESPASIAEAVAVLRALQIPIERFAADVAALRDSARFDRGAVTTPVQGLAETLDRALARKGLKPRAW